MDCCPGSVYDQSRVGHIFHGARFMELISKKKFEEIMSPRNKDEKQKMKLARDMRDRKVDVKKDAPNRT